MIATMQYCLHALCLSKHSPLFPAIHLIEQGGHSFFPGGCDSAALLHWRLCPLHPRLRSECRTWGKVKPLGWPPCWPALTTSAPESRRVHKRPGGAEHVAGLQLSPCSCSVSTGCLIQFTQSWRKAGFEVVHRKDLIAHQGEEWFCGIKLLKRKHYNWDTVWTHMRWNPWNLKKMKLPVPWFLTRFMTYTQACTQRIESLLQADGCWGQPAYIRTGFDYSRFTSDLVLRLSHWVPYWYPGVI